MLTTMQNQYKLFILKNIVVSAMVVIGQNNMASELLIY